MRNYQFLLLILCLSSRGWESWAQGAPPLEATLIPSAPFSRSTSADGVLTPYGGGSNPAGSRLSYDRIKGSPFWKDEFIMASLLDPQNRLLGKIPVKLNLYTNEVYFLLPGNEVRVAEAGRVSKLVFYKNDSSAEVMAVFENGLPLVPESNPNATGPSFVQVLNTGSVQLLKHSKVMLVSADSLFGTMKRYYFSVQSHYYLHTQYGQMFRLKKLQEQAVTERLNLDEAEHAFIDERKLSLKTEQEILLFLEFLNKKRQTSRQ
jgi:hypothetical protein